ncbi:hypothetical protein N7509_011080 [Penicillium cosmopolitanum]|uniref:Uncharacterized protein n=1 Tax=Penicillium cosmopolitanum TaxID=1131564 RepID=A0A9W9VST7_9EURO|nr:uncharacterized protein N7509_011080 [Penicillium cosmopolitanum]KAJ5388539.1 hypothetical protein N7509_011080 [Penicillium cosmopolitanum]
MVSGPFMSFFLLIGLIANLVLAGVLGIAKDTSLEPYKLHSYGSVCDFKNEPSNDQFLNLIQQAYDDMRELTDKVQKNHHKPSAMIGLAIGNQVYFSSSVRSDKSKPIIYKLSYPKKGGDGSFNKLPEMPEQFKKVTDALEACSKEANSDPQHKSNGMCGSLHGGGDGYLPPCSGDPGSPQWGCNKWTKEMKFEVIEDTNKNRDRKDTPEPTSTKNVALEKCAKVEQPKGKGKGGKRDEESS